jgi:anoctamin-10
MDEFLQLFLQFGYVYFFSAVFPTAAVFALIGSFVKIRTNAFTLCCTYKRPFSQPVANIGAWQVSVKILQPLQLTK